jgi:hypothetical protein
LQESQSTLAKLLNLDNIRVLELNFETFHMFSMSFMNLTILGAQKPTTNGIFGAIGSDEDNFRRRAGKQTSINEPLAIKRCFRGGGL